MVAPFTLTVIPSFAGDAGKIVQVAATEDGVEFGQRLGPNDTPSFMILTVQRLDNLGDELVAGSLEVQGDALFLGTLDANGELNVVDKNITIGNVGLPTDLTADGGGLTLRSAAGNKTFLWLNSLNAWALNQGMVVQDEMSVGAVAAPVADCSIDLKATDKAFLLNRLTTIQRDALAATNGMVIYNTTTNNLEFFNGTLWASLGSAEVAGPASSTDNAIARFDGTSGKIIQNSSVTIDDAGTLVSTGIISADIMIANSQIIAGNLRLNGNTLSSDNANGDIILAPNGTGKAEIAGQIKITGGNPGNSKFLRSDADGLATWGDVGWSDIGTVVALINGSDSVGMGAIPDASTKLDVASTTKGFLAPRMTETQRDAIITPATGLQIYNATVDKYEIFTGAVWKTFLTEDLGTVVAQETFASTNVRFFGELALPAAQGWTDTPTGSATIDLQTQLVFGVSKQVIRHNDNVTNGAVTSKITLTAQNWIDINNFGASYSGISRLDTVSGASGFFSGLQANAAENPQATGNRRYGVLFNTSLGNLSIDEPDGGAPTAMDGTGGNPLIPFDEWFSWEIVVPAGLGPAQVLINGLPTTVAPEFRVNIGGLGTTIQVGSGSTSGANRIVYHDNFGVTIFEGSTTKTLLATTMEADIVQVNIPEGKRDYTIILPDGNPRALGSVLRVVANNLFGKITLENQNPAAPQILYNGLRTLAIDVFVKEIIEGINTVDQGNVYLGFKAEDIDRAKSIFAQLSSSVDQVPVDTNPTVITYNTQDEINGIGHSTSLNPGELEILPGSGGVYFVSPQPQVGKDMATAKTDFGMFWEIDRGSGFVDEPNSNVKITIKDSDITTTASSAFTITLNVGDKIRMLQRVSDSGVGLGLKNTDPEVGPPTVPRTPSIILTMYRIGGIAA